MSAGIVSACLPTLGPIFAYGARKLGINMKGSVLGSRGTNDDSNKGQSGTGRSTGERPDVETAKSKNSTPGTFYRLSDDNGSRDKARDRGSVDVGLRPEHQHEYMVASKPGKGEGDSLSGDESLCRESGCKSTSSTRQEGGGSDESGTHMFVYMCTNTVYSRYINGTRNQSSLRSAPEVSPKLLPAVMRRLGVVYPSRPLTLAKPFKDATSSPKRVRY